MITVSDSDFTASVEFDDWGEEGNIILPSSYYKIKDKFGISEQEYTNLAQSGLASYSQKGLFVWLDGEWLLQKDDQVVAVARKPNPLTRVFKVSHQEQVLILKAKFPFTKSFVVEQDNQLLGTIKPINSWTKQALIDCSSSISVSIQIFMFWLTSLMWRRAEQRKIRRM
ncbi:MAG: hypothetical protein WA919_26680 [Coleofasciculaceae cyanobacterium]